METGKLLWRLVVGPVVRVAMKDTLIEHVHADHNPFLSFESARQVLPRR